MKPIRVKLALQEPILTSLFRGSVCHFYNLSVSYAQLTVSQYLIQVFSPFTVPYLSSPCIHTVIFLQTCAWAKALVCDAQFWALCPPRPDSARSCWFSVTAFPSTGKFAGVFYHHANLLQHCRNLEPQSICQMWLKLPIVFRKCKDGQTHSTIV